MKKITFLIILFYLTILPSKILAEDKVKKKEAAEKNFEKIFIENLSMRTLYRQEYLLWIIWKDYYEKNDNFYYFEKEKLISDDLEYDISESFDIAFQIYFRNLKITQKVKEIYNGLFNFEYKFEHKKGNETEKKSFYLPFLPRPLIREEENIEILTKNLESLKNLGGAFEKEKLKIQEEINKERALFDRNILFRMKFGLDILPIFENKRITKLSLSRLDSGPFLLISYRTADLKISESMVFYQNRQDNKISLQFQNNFSDKLNLKISGDYFTESKEKSYNFFLWSKNFGFVSELSAHYKESQDSRNTLIGFKLTKELTPTFVIDGKLEQDHFFKNQKYIINFNYLF